MGPAVLVFIATGMLGLIFGSFATALIHRVPAGLSWSFSGRTADGTREDVPRSACPHCHATLQAIDLVPLFSWLLLRGRCRHCGAPIGWSYPAIELLTALSGLGIVSGWGLTPQTGVLLFTTPFLMALAVIDLRHFILPNVLNAALAVLWPFFLLAGVFEGQEWRACALTALWGLAAAVLYAALALGLSWLMKKMLKKEALGMGDVKFFAVAGLWLGATLLPWFLMLAGILGVILGVAYRIMAKNVYFPFGPALIAAFYVLLVLARPGAIP